MEITRVAVPVETRAPGGRTNAYLVDGLLVDPAARTADLDAAVSDRRVAHVAVTHAHPDHVGAVAAYATERGATVWAHGRFAERFERAAGVAPDRTFREGDRVGPATVVETPGHAPDHVAFALDARGPDDRDGSAGAEALVGDLAVAEGSVLVGGTDADLRAYLDSLRRLLDREPSRLHPGHGPRIDDPDATLRRLIARREERERRVLGAVRSGESTVGGIVDAAYGRDLSGVRDLAGLAVVAHLEKLEAEGAIEWDGERATPRS